MVILIDLSSYFSLLLTCTGLSFSAAFLSEDAEPWWASEKCVRVPSAHFLCC